MYRVILADPPWKFGSRLRNGTPKANGTKNTRFYHVPYPEMTTKEICAMPIKDICEKDAALFIWTTDAHIPDCLEVIKAWGFKYSTVAFVWVKKEKSGVTSCHVGHWTNKSSEICFIATRGRMSKYIQSRKVRQLIEACRDKHSRKPSESHERIEMLFGDVSKVELFARSHRAGWDVFGNQVEGSIHLPTPRAAESPDLSDLNGAKVSIAPNIKFALDE